MQCRALLANAVGDAAGYAEIVTRYRDLAEELDVRGHLAVAKQLAAEPAFGAAPHPSNHLRGGRIHAQLTLE